MGYSLQLGKRGGVGEYNRPELLAIDLAADHDFGPGHRDGSHSRSASSKDLMTD
jgi:hypothetical protein